MERFREFREQNRKLWDEITPIHYEHPDYKVTEFLDGKSTLYDLLISELGDIKGKEILHMMCHFGLDTLSLARLDADVTGVDFSETSIKYARRLTELSNLKAKFVESDIYDIHDQCDDLFDIVFSSIGILCWLPDLNLWAKNIETFLKPGGFFYFAEDHPIALTFSEELEEGDTYFHKDEPSVYSGNIDYCDPDYKCTNKSYEWAWTVGDVVSALCNAGLKIEYLHEFPYGLYKRFKNMENRNGKWWIPGKENIVPLTFTLKAVKSNH